MQDHTAYNLARSARGKSFMVPHGVDMQRFKPGNATDFRGWGCLIKSATM